VKHKSKKETRKTKEKQVGEKKEERMIKVGRQRRNKGTKKEVK
jgi:hypothetical protein